MDLKILNVTPEKGLRLLKTAGSKRVTEELLAADLEEAGLLEGETFSLVDLAAHYIRVLNDGLS